MNWANNYNAWNYVVGKKKSKKNPPTVIQIIDSDDGETIVKELKTSTSDITHARALSPEVIIVDDSEGARKTIGHIEVPLTVKNKVYYY